MSTAVATKTHHTPEDLLAMPDGKSYELVRGQLVERNLGVESSWVGSRILVRLGHFCEEHKTWLGVAGRLWLSVLPSRSWHGSQTRCLLRQDRPLSR